MEHKDYPKFIVPCTAKRCKGDVFVLIYGGSKIRIWNMRAEPINHLTVNGVGLSVDITLTATIEGERGRGRTGPQ